MALLIPLMLRLMNLKVGNRPDIGLKGCRGGVGEGGMGLGTRQASLLVAVESWWSTPGSARPCALAFGADASLQCS